MYGTVLNQPQPMQGLPNNFASAGATRTSPNDVATFAKALVSGGAANPSVSGGSVHQIQSLDGVMKIQTFKMKHLYLWNQMKKTEVYALAHQYSLQSGYGSGGIFTNGAESGQLQDAIYQRKLAQVKYMSVQKEVEHPLLMVQPAHGGLISREVNNGAVYMLKELERATFFANSSIIPQEFDGIDAQLFEQPDFADTQVIDMRGKHLGREHLEEGSNRIQEAFGDGSGLSLYMKPRAASALNRELFSSQRHASIIEGRYGVNIKEITTAAGDVKLRSTPFLRPGNERGSVAPPTGATSAFAPPAPTIATSLNATTESYFYAADAGDYQYVATAVNRFGESAPSAASAAVSVAAGNYVTVTITSGGGSTAGFKLYRLAKNSSTVSTGKLIRHIPLSGTTGTYPDDNYLLPGHGRAYLLNDSAENKEFGLLAPMMRLPLAVVAPAVRWLQLLYGMPLVYTPLFNTVYINVPDTDAPNYVA